MKKTPQQQKLEEMLRSSKLVMGGFLGTDTRDLDEVIDHDQSTLDRLGYSRERLAERMQQLTDLAVPRLGLWVSSEDGVEVMSIDYKGAIVCPWPHGGKFAKRFTTAKNIETGDEVCWTDLQIHMIKEHGFFQGKGAFFRIEPEMLIKTVFPESRG